MNPGWYPDPDDPNARRFWDGESWSAPLPIATTASPLSGPSCANPQCNAVAAAASNYCDEHRPALPGQRVAPTPCAVGPCALPRVNGGIYCSQHGPKKRAASTPASSARAQILCPHCQVRGRVTSKSVKQKKGISGAKVTGAVLTAGFSILGTGLSRKEKVTEMHCGNCGTTWVV